jgi:hypothetical protein
MDFKFECPFCAQHLAAPADMTGSAVNCPTCGNEFAIPAPGEASEAPEAPPNGGTIDHDVKRWIVDVRVLILRAPPIYVAMLLEVPKNWTLPQGQLLPELALNAITQAVHARFPNCPATAVKVRPADEESLKKISANAEYCDECCRVWLLGKVT